MSERSKNRGGGPEAASADRIRKQAGSHARGTMQKKGSGSQYPPMGKKAKWQKREGTEKDACDEMEF